MKALSSKRMALKAGVIAPEQTVCRHVVASFCPDILPAVAMKGLKKDCSPKRIEVVVI